MKTTKPLFTLALLLCCSACNKESIDNTESYSLTFYPREVSSVWISPGITVKNSFTIDGKQMTAYDFAKSESGKIRATELFLSICTSNKKPYDGQFIVMGDADPSKDNRIPTLERQIEADFRSPVTRTNLVMMEYRTIWSQITCRHSRYNMLPRLG